MGKKFMGLGGTDHFWDRAKAWILNQITAAVAAKIAEVVANAPEDLDTLKEIADWIKNHANDAAAMNTQIQTNKSNIATNTSDISALNTQITENKSNIAANTSDISALKTSVAGKADKVHTHSAGDITSGTLPIANGGTGATGAKGAFMNLANGLTQASNPQDAEYMIYKSGGNWGLYTLLQFWEYIKGKISSVLGLTKDNYGGKAASAGKASFLDEYVGAGVTRLTSGNIVPKDASEYGGMRKDVVTLSMTDSGRPGYDGHLLTMFWDNNGRYDSQFFVSNETPPTVKVRTKANGADYGPWTDIITSNNIGSQTVANATNARTNADQGFLCKLYTIDSATSDATVQAYNVILLGKIPDPASTAAPATPASSWDIDVDFYFVRTQGHKASWCNVKAGYGYSNAWRKYGSIETFGVDSNSNYTHPFDLVTLKYNNEYYIGVRHMIDIDGSYAARVKYVNTGGSRNPFTVNNTPLVNMLKVIPYQKTNGTILNSEIKTSIADFPNTYAPTVIRNGSLVLPSGSVRVGNSAVAGSRLTIHGATVNSNSYTDTNPKLEFKNNDGSQNISLTFTDFDTVQAPASLTLNGNQGNEYFIAPNIKAKNRAIIPIGAPSSLEDGCIWIER